MTDSFAFTIFLVAFAIYGVWAVRRDMRRGIASARGFQFERETQPKRYRALMRFNGFAVGLICIGAIIQLIRFLAKL
jgi:hypothetical protein